MKKYLIYTICCIVSVVSLVGCNGSIPSKNEQQSSSAQQSTEQSTNNTSKDEDVVESNKSTKDFKLVEFSGKTYSEGRLTVGKDLDEGLYVVYGDKQGVLNVYNSSMLVASYTVESGSNSYVELHDNDVVELQNVIMGSSDEAKLNKKDGVYVSGMYLIGKDIPEGSYIMTADELGGIYEYYSDCSFSVSSLIASSSITKATTISLKSGNYLVLSNAELVKE